MFKSPDVCFNLYIHFVLFTTTLAFLLIITKLRLSSLKNIQTYNTIEF